ncbi:MAG: CopG family transcriptional regulator [Candidatus Njordarchaeales archaeon]
MGSEEFVSVKIPKKLYDRILREIKDTEFKTVDDFVTYVLEQVLEEEEETVYSKEEEEAIKERLRSLGYL